MAQETASKVSSKTAYFLAGLGIGSVLTILLAPRWGEESRQDLSQRASELRHQAAIVFEHGEDVLIEKTEQLAVALDPNQDLQETPKIHTAGAEGG